MAHPTADQLTAAALPGEPDDPAVSAHLRDCAACAAEVDALRRTVGHARDGMTLEVHPPPAAEVWDGILARLDDDAPAAAPAAVVPTRVPTRGRPSRRLLGAGLALALVALVALVVGLTASTGAPGAPPATARVSLVAAQPGVTGTVEGRPGHAMHVEVTVPDPVPGGHDLEVWDTAAGVPRSLGVLRADGGRTHWQADLALPGTGGMPPLDVSLEPTGAGPEHSGLSLAHSP